MSKHDLLPVPCLYCDKRFAGREAADAHMLRSHRNFYYLADRAERRANFLTHMARLERLPHRCRQCKRRFASLEALQRHTAARHIP